MRAIYRGFGVCFVVVGMLQLVLCLLESSRALAANGWPTTKGVVQSSEVALVKGGKGDGHVPAVTYAYSVSGVSYVGDRIHFRDVSEMPEQAERAVASFPVGAEVAVHFDPDEPSKSLLRPGLYSYSFTWLGLSLAAIVVGSGIVYFYRPNAS